jgi:hypothetical protein
VRRELARLDAAYMVAEQSGKELAAMNDYAATDIARGVETLDRGFLEEL